MAKNHAIIAFEGLDCSFKETNYNSFVFHLREMRSPMGFKIHTENFPRYGNKACIAAERWLNGSYDRAMLKQHPKAVCSFYSIDRLDYWYKKKSDGIRRIELLNDTEKFHYFVFDRYSLSNPIYNPLHPGEINIEDFVFDRDIYGIPNPTKVVWMRMKNFDVLAGLIAQKENKDQNELDIEFIRGVWERSEQIIASDIFDKLGIELIVVDCLNNDNSIKNRLELSEYVWMKAAAPV